MKWRIYYTDGSTFSDEDGTPSQAPGQGALVITMANLATGRDILHLADYYVHKGGRWYGVDLFGLLDHVLNLFDEIDGVIAGRTVSDQAFRAAYEHAKHDPAFPVKSATRSGERPLHHSGGKVD